VFEDHAFEQGFDDLLFFEILLPRAWSGHRDLNNPAIPYGSMGQRWINNDVYIYERKFFGNVVLVAINKNETTSYNITGLNTSLPAGLLCLKSPYVAALPPDVRRGFASPAHSSEQWATPSCGLCASVSGPKAHTRGQAHFFFTTSGEAKPRPTSGGRAVLTTFGAKSCRDVTKII
jgi:hypothetical protein